jgi:RNA polymerase subunit RPABC4/transcription elongation factor Spt4
MSVESNITHDETIHCIACGNVVEPKAETCPNCGQPSPAAKKIELMTCHKCGGVVSADAVRCPRCRARPQWDFIKLIVTAVKALVITVIIGDVFSLSDLSDYGMLIVAILSLYVVYSKSFRKPFIRGSGDAPQYDRAE